MWELGHHLALEAGTIWSTYLVPFYITGFVSHPEWHRCRVYSNYWSWELFRKVTENPQRSLVSKHLLKANPKACQHHYNLYLSFLSLWGHPLQLDLSLTSDEEEALLSGKWPQILCVGSLPASFCNTLCPMCQDDTNSSQLRFKRKHSLLILPGQFCHVKNSVHARELRHLANIPPTTKDVAHDAITQHLLTFRLTMVSWVYPDGAAKSLWEWL